MLFKNFVYVVLCFLFMVVFVNEKVSSVSILDDTKIYNMDVGNNIIVYEHEEIIDDRKVHYISFYNKENNFYGKILSNGGEIINDDMFFPSISENDRYISFSSRASNITGETSLCYNIIDDIYSNCSHIYIYDTKYAKSFMIKNENDFLNGDSFISKISGDGSSVVFESFAVNILNYDRTTECFKNSNNICTNIYKYNISLKKLLLVSTNKSNHGGNSNSLSPSISFDGRYVTFQSAATNLVAGNYSFNDCDHYASDDSMGCSYIYFFDSKQNSLEIITKSEDVLYNDSSGNAIISGDGNFIVYESYATNIELNYNGNQHIVMYDKNSKKNIILSKKSNFLYNRDSHILDVSKNGKYIIFMSNSTNLDSSGKNCIYVYNHADNKIASFFSGVESNVLINIGDDFVCFYNNSNIVCDLIDKEPPFIEKNQVIYVVKNSSANLIEKIDVSDNLSGKNELEIYVSDELIFNEIGEYSVDVSAVDYFGNVSNEIVKFIVLEKDKEPPVFNDIKEIKVLKGSSTLNLSNYVEAFDKVDGYTKIYILDDGNLNLNNTGKYIIELMSKDESENISYKSIDIIVYENYNFTYFYELLLILGVILLIIFSIIKVK